MNQSLLFYGKSILFLGAHPDDIELGCGAFIAHIADRSDIRCVTLSDNQKNPALKNLVEEHYRSMLTLGVPKEKIILGKFETRRFPQARQEILEYLFELNKQLQPEIVFVHTRADLHQDHATIAEEALRAFRGTSVFGYDVIRSSHGFFPSFLIEVNEQDVELKIKALAEYHTYDNKYYFKPDVTRATLIRNGAIAERNYAEAFDILRMIGTFGKLVP
jgi:LmbE family N-acetylglucosaminyl deacetylase